MSDAHRNTFFCHRPTLSCRHMNRVALITGGSRGIGRGIALELAKRGHDLVINFAGNVAAAQQTVRDCTMEAGSSGQSIRAELCQADISQSRHRQEMIAFTRREFGRLDLLVNNAGVAPDIRSDLLESSEESFDRLMAINAKGPYFLTQLAAKWMVEQVKALGARDRPKTAAETTDGAYHPMIITIGSISAYTASTNRGDYCLAKAALAMLTPLFASRLAEDGILVYEIRPGIIATDMTGPVKDKYEKLIAEGLTPIKRWGLPQDIGRAVVAIAEGALPFSTGEVINVDGGFHLRRL
jgi:3-oxoacyl-[acyl-carrier protein] reductase